MSKDRDLTAAAACAVDDRPAEGEAGSVGQHDRAVATSEERSPEVRGYTGGWPSRDVPKSPEAVQLATREAELETALVKLRQAETELQMKRVELEKNRVELETKRVEYRTKRVGLVAALMGLLAGGAIGHVSVQKDAARKDSVPVSNCVTNVTVNQIQPGAR